MEIQGNYRIGRPMGTRCAFVLKFARFLVCHLIELVQAGVCPTKPAKARRSVRFTYKEPG